MNMRRVIFLILIAIAGLTACRNNPDGQANLNGEPITPLVDATQSPEQPTTAPANTEEIAPTPSMETPIAEPINPAEPPVDAPTTQPEQPTAAPTEVVIPPMGETADALKQAWGQAYALPAGVPFAVTLTEAQIEALIAESMAKSSYGSKVSSIDVTLNNGQIGVTFGATISQKVGPRTVDVSGTANIVFNATIDANGKLALTVASAALNTAGGQQISIPPEMLSVLNTAVSQALTGASSSAESEVTLTELTISGGSMTVKGYVTP